MLEEFDVSEGPFLKHTLRIQAVPLVGISLVIFKQYNYIQRKSHNKKYFNHWIWPVRYVIRLKQSFICKSVPSDVLLPTVHRQYDFIQREEWYQHCGILRISCSIRSVTACSDVFLHIEVCAVNRHLAGHLYEVWFYPKEILFMKCFNQWICCSKMPVTGQMSSFRYISVPSAVLSPTVHRQYDFIQRKRICTGLNHLIWNWTYKILRVA